MLSRNIKVLLEDGSGFELFCGATRDGKDTIDYNLRLGVKDITPELSENEVKDILNEIETRDVELVLEWEQKIQSPISKNKTEEKLSKNKKVDFLPQSKIKSITITTTEI